MPQGMLVILNNNKALQSIFYTKEFTFATVFTKKITILLYKIVPGPKIGPKRAFLRGFDTKDTTKMC